MGVRYRAEFTSDIEAVEWKVDIHDADYSSTVTTFKVETPGFTLIYEGNNVDKHAPILPSHITVHAMSENAAFNTLLSDIAGAQEQRFSIVVYKDGNLYWAGHMLTDLIQWEDAPFPYKIGLRATDYLAALKDFDYDNGGTLYTGYDTIIDHIGKLLSKTNLAQFWGASANYLRTAVDWWEYRMGARTTAKDPLELTRFSHESIYDVDDEGLNAPKKVYDVLSMILRNFGARLTLSEGMWNIIQPNEYNPFVINFRYYNKSGTKISSAAETAQNKSIDQSSIAKIATGTNTYIPALNEVQMTYKAGRDYLEDKKYPALTTVGVARDGDMWRLYIAIDILWEPPPEQATGQYFFSFEITLKVGSYYLQGWSEKPFVPIRWVNTPGPTSKYFLDELKINPNFNGEYISVFDSIRAPELVTGGDIEFKLEFKYIQWYKDGFQAQQVINPDPADFSWVVRTLKLTSFDDNSIANNDFIFAAQNETGGSEVDSKLVFKIPDTELGQLDRGQLFTNNGATWDDAISWKEGATAGAADDNINQLVVDETLSERMTPSELMSAQVDGEFSAVDRLTYDSVDYILSSATFLAARDRWDGEWFEIHRAIAAITQIGTVQSKNDINGLTFDVGEVSGDLSRLAGMTVLDRFNDGIGITSLNQTIEDGDILTSIDITALGIDLLQDGDEIIIMNPSGFEQYETLTVNADQSSSDTSLTIDSHEFEYDYPAGAILFWDGKMAGEKFKYKTDGTVGGLNVTATEIGSGSDKVKINSTTGVVDMVNVGLKNNSSNVSNPPTDSELDAIFGSPSDLGAGRIGFVTDSDSDNTYQVMSDGSFYYVLTGTKVVPAT
jgi:hypothetical protein